MEAYLKELETAFRAEFQKFAEELKSVRSSRPSLGLIEDVKVEAYGQTLTIKELGSLSVRPPRDIEVNVWDKSAVGSVMKALEARGGLSVSSSGGEGNIVRVTLPPLTEERKAEFTKLAKKMTEASRIQVRNRRDDIMKKLKASEADEDLMFKAKEKIQVLTDKMNKDIETALEAKIKELNE